MATLAVVLGGYAIGGLVIITYNKLTTGSCTVSGEQAAGLTAGVAAGAASAHAHQQFQQHQRNKEWAEFQRDSDYHAGKRQRYYTSQRQSMTPPR